MQPPVTPAPTPAEQAAGAPNRTRLPARWRLHPTLRRPVLAWLAGSIAATVAIWASTLWLHQGRQQTAIDKEYEHHEAVATSVAEITRRLLEVADRALLAAAEDITAGMSPAVAVERALDRSALGGDIVTALRFIGPDGAVQGETRARLPLRTLPLNFAGRDFFRVHVEQPAHGLYVSRTYSGPRTGAVVFALTRRVDRPDGGLRGVLQIALDASYFGRNILGLSLAPNPSVGLVGHDGAYRVRMAFDRTLAFDEHAPMDHPMQRLISAGHAQARLRARSAIVADELLFAMRQVDGFPLSVVVTTRAADATAPVRSAAIPAFGAAALATLLLWGGGLLAMALLSRLASARERLEGALGELEAALGEARAGERAKASFLASMSHELRTPLTGILGYAQLIELRTSDERARPLAATIHRSAERLTALLNEVLDAAKVEAGAMHVHVAPAPVREIVAEACTLFLPAIEGKGLVLRQAIDPRVPEQVDCDAMRLRQILNNLLSNAVKFTAQGTIDVALARVADRLELTVTDTGCGIGSADTERLFRRFSQGSEQVAHQHGGTGLGLSLSRDFARLMGGELSLRPAPGAGACFVLSLPLPAAA